MKTEKFKSMKVSIFEPCPANWENMKIKLHARHCDQCDKSVVDFTKKSRAEIITYLIENPEQRIELAKRASSFANQYLLPEVGREIYRDWIEKSC